MTNRILVGAVFLVGCAVGGAGSQLVVPKASAQQAATLTKWEYSCVDLDIDDLDPTAKKFGAQGWEISAMSTRGASLVTCFRRAKM